MVDPVIAFDTAALSRLRTLTPNFFEEVSEDNLTPIESRKSKTYAIFFGNDLVPGTEYAHMPVTGSSTSSVLHFFSVFVVANSPGVRNALVSKVRQLFEGQTITASSGMITETGTMNSYADSDPTLKPIKYTYMLSYKVTVDRGNNEVP